MFDGADDGTDEAPYLKITLLKAGVDKRTADPDRLDPHSVQTTHMQKTRSPEWEGTLELELPSGHPRAPLVRVSVWDKDWSSSDSENNS